MRGALDVRHVGGWLDPRQPGFGEGHVPTPSINGGDTKLDSDSDLPSIVSSQFPQRHAVAHRQRISTYERGERRVEDVALHGATDWIRTIEYNHGDPLFSSRLHGEGHRGYVGPVAGPDVLVVHKEDVDSVKHLRRRTEHRAVQGVDRYTGLDVHVVRNRSSRVGRAPDAVLGGEEGHKVHIRMFMNPIDRGTARAVHAGLIGDQPDSTTRHQVNRVLQEDLNSRANQAEPCTVILV